MFSLRLVVELAHRTPACLLLAKASGKAIPDTARGDADVSSSTRVRGGRSGGGHLWRLPQGHWSPIDVGWWKFRFCHWIDRGRCVIDTRNFN